MKRILKFYSTTCGPCKVMSKNMEGIEGIEEYDIYDDKNLDIVSKYKIRSVPTIIITDEDGELIKKFNGIVPIEDIKSALE